MAEIVISEFMDRGAVADLGRDHEVMFDPGLWERPGDLIATLGDARALIVRNRTAVRGAVLEAGPRLRAIGRLGVGLDNIDLSACAARGIAVLPATGANDTSVAEYVIAATLLLLRGAFGATEVVLRGEWPREALIGHEIAGKWLGLVGYGSIARTVARKARALDMMVAAYDPHVAKGEPAWTEVRHCRTLDALLASAEVLSLHVPLLPTTRNLIDGAALARLRPGAVLINTARGGIVDEAALVEALRAGHLAGAALDVFTEEPLSAAAARKFAGLPNLILTPHVAGPTKESDVRVSAITAAKVRQVLQDTGSRRVDGDLSHSGHFASMS